eukprot:Skav231178  [mRNA]  locus=scaffold425:15866:18192:- [translate_table: standard]
MRPSSRLTARDLGLVVHQHVALHVSLVPGDNQPFQPPLAQVLLDAQKLLPCAASGTRGVRRGHQLDVSARFKKAV